jgi:hypothetical protein
MTTTHITKSQTVAEALPEIFNHLAAGGTVAFDSPIGYRELYGEMTALLAGISIETALALRADMGDGDERSAKAYKAAVEAIDSSLFYPQFKGDAEAVGYDFTEAARRIQLRHPDRDVLAVSGMSA